jgi:RNA recognition motif-containing protein
MAEEEHAAENAMMQLRKRSSIPDSQQPCKQKRRSDDNNVILEDHENDCPDTVTAAADSAASMNSRNRPSTDSSPSNRPEEPKTKSSNTSVVYVSHLPARYGTEAIVEKMMQKYGTIVRIHTCHNQHGNTTTKHPTGRNNNHPYWFVEFASIQQAQNARSNLHGRSFAGQSIVVRPAHQQDKQSRMSSSANHQPKAISMQQQQQQIHRVESQIRAIQNKLKTKK